MDFSGIPPLVTALASGIIAILGSKAVEQMIAQWGKSNDRRADERDDMRHYQSKRIADLESEVSALRAETSKVKDLYFEQRLSAELMERDLIRLGGMADRGVAVVQQAEQIVSATLEAVKPSPPTQAGEAGA